MKWLSISYWWNLLMGDSEDKKSSTKRGRPKGSKNKPKTRKKKK
jgi:hypothetical protein